jgi:hypothetical protein
MHYQYYNSATLLLVNKKGEIRRLNTPFTVVCVVAVASIRLNTRVYVEEVVSNEKDELHYVILSHIYLYKHFKILINF